MKYTILFFIFSVAMVVSLPAISDNDDDKYWSVIDSIEAELLIPLGSSDANGLYERRERLRQLFSNVPLKYAIFLSQSLEAQEEELSKLFHRKLATATRNELQNILIMLDKSYYVDSELTDDNTSSEKDRDNDFDANQKSTFELALIKMNNAIDEHAEDPRTGRYKCWINKLDNPDVDDRIIQWKHVCNRESVGTYVGTPFSSSCELLSKYSYISESEMFEKIKSVSDVDVLNDTRMMTSMKEHVLNYGETGVFKYNMPVPHDGAQKTVEILGEWASSPQGAGSKMPHYYRHIKGWIKKQQNNPLSLYSCY